MEQQEVESLLVSVVIPNYNCGRYIGRAIESILNQTESNYELLICDDGSVDNSVTVIKQWQERDSRIKLFINERNEGHIYTYNRLFNEAKGDYIMIQDADDWSNVKRIQRQLETIKKFQVQLCLCNSILHSKSENFQPKLGSGYLTITTKETMAPATLMFQRQVLKKVPGFSTYFTRATVMDRYFIMELLTYYSGYYLDEHLYHILVRPNSDHRSIDLKDASYLRKLVMYDIYQKLKHQRVTTGTDWLAQNDLQALKNYENKLIADNSLVSERLRVLACIQIDHHKIHNAWIILKKAIGLSPLYFNNYRSLFYLIRKKLKP
jgi:glycosyltransferase involved in cell wall biosynthesis